MYVPPFVSHLTLTRRQLLRAGALAAVAGIPGGRALARVARGLPPEPAPQLFLSSDEVALLDAIMARILPTDTQPGAREAGVVLYVQGLLSALPDVDANCDGRRTAADLTAILLQLGASADADVCGKADVNRDGTIDAADVTSAELALIEARPLYAGGPFSGRQPFGDFAAGQATNVYPTNSFENFLPLNRLQRLSWKVRLDGATGVDEVADNPLATSLPEADLRRKYRDGLAAIERASQSMFGVPFIALTTMQQDQLLELADADFHNLLTGHAIEGLLCAPEYGGNRDRIGWTLVGYDGDSQPLGYTLGFDEATQEYVERADKPNSKPNPNENCAGFSSTVTSFIRTIASAEETQPNKFFRTPFCFEVAT